MTYLKSALVGVFAALFAVIIVVLAMTRFWMSEGSSATFIVIDSWQILLAALVGFAARFWWTLRRARARHV